ncbi:MAG: hypothetical protein IPN74_20160 [Haliscomenobacter sp.]|nr:hypothetical protein [Haliscomenobacter sp.]
MKRKNLSLSVVFDRAHRLTATGTGLVQIRATFAGQTRYFSTGVHVRPEQWDHRNRRVKEHALASEYNRRIYAYLDRLQEQEIELQKSMDFAAWIALPSTIARLPSPFRSSANRNCNALGSPIQPGETRKAAWGF